MTIWFPAVLIVVVAACVQSVIGFGFGLTAVPVLTLLYGTYDGIVLNMMMSTATSLFVAWRTRRDAVGGLVRPLAVGAQLGVLPGFAAYYLLPVRALRLGIAAVLVCAVVLRLCGTRLVLPHSSKGSLVAGTSSGIIHGSISLGGVPASLYLSGGDLDKRAYRATMAKYVLIVNIISLPATSSTCPRMTGR